LLKIEVIKFRRAVIVKNVKMWVVAVAVGMLGHASTVQAVPITGSINFIGGATLNGSGSAGLSDATAFTGFSSLGVLTATGTYSAILVNGVSSVSFQTFSFAGGVLSPSPLQYLWSVTDGLGNTYTFEATDAMIVSQYLNPDGTSFLNITGDGYAFLNGGDQTAGTWSITDTGSSKTQATFTFGSATTVPDGGTTAMLLGIGLSAVVLLRKRLTA
jgi:VPDSG-CTERM motif